MAGSILDLPRASGILLHVTSLPGPGVGDFGEQAHRWLEWLAAAGQHVWQILPLVPIDAGGSPYNGLSAMAGNHALIAPQGLVADGLLPEAAVEPPQFPAGRVDYAGLLAWKDRLLREAFDRFRGGAAPQLRAGLARFRERHQDWLEDYALFRAVREAHQAAAWTEWELPIRLREPRALEQWRARLADRLDDHVFRQFLFERQWQALHRRAGELGIRIIGDIPIFVAHDSSDVWAHRELFWLDERGHPTVVAGVPPDYFSVTGQRWGNPLYRWDRLAQRGYRWWTRRFRRIFEQVDIARVDHFRGFEAYWQIPADEPTAVNGHWVPGPGLSVFAAVEAALGRLPIIAEDLGLITPEVEELRQRLGFPGMRVLQFAFDLDPRNPHLPRNYPPDCVAYTGTHDNPPVVEWWSAAEAVVREQVEQLGVTEGGEIHWDLMRLVLESPAELAVLPLQDVLGLGSEARMNTPGTTEGNWLWRADAGALTPAVQQQLRDLCRRCSRLPPARAA
jgi:4-alpha-glucanotransferase